MKVGRNHLTGFAIISGLINRPNLTPRILTKFVGTRLLLDAMQCRWRMLTNASVLQLIALIRSENHFLCSSLKHDPSWILGIVLCQSQKKTTTQKHHNVSDHEQSWWKYKTDRWMYYETQRKRVKKLRSPGCSCAQLLRAARWSAEGAEAAEIVVRTSSRSGSGYYGSWQSTGGSPLVRAELQWALREQTRSCVQSARAREREKEREREQFQQGSDAALSLAEMAYIIY